jgi:CheY-like chemotaxis protein
MHGGTVSAFSAGEGQGSEFKVTLPTLQSDDAPNLLASVSSSPARLGRVILVVDDNEDANQSTAMMLECEGHQVASAYDGPSGLEAARRIMPDAILLDIGLPGMDGYEVARRLREEPATRHIHVIALTGYGQSSDIEQSRTAGIDHHLVKPARLQDILEQIERLSSRKLH